MELIFRFIMKIISEIHERDVKHRKGEKKEKSKSGSPEQSLDDWLKGSAPSPTYNEPENKPENNPEYQAAEKDLEAWLNTPKATPNLAPPKKRLAPPQSLKKKSKKKKKQFKAQELPPKFPKKVKPVAEPKIHHDEKVEGAYAVKTAKKAFELPGKTALEKMMWAQIIMNPCKAMQGQGRR